MSIEALESSRIAKNENNLHSELKAMLIVFFFDIESIIIIEWVPA